MAGVTTSVSFSMLNSIASSPEQVIRVENFTGLEPSFFDISKRFCDDPLGTYPYSFQALYENISVKLHDEYFQKTLDITLACLL